MLLLPEQFVSHPFHDSTGLLGDPDGLRAHIAAEGYLFFDGLVAPEVLAALRRWVRERCARRGWARPDPHNGPHLLAAPGASMEGRGWDDPGWVALQRELAHAPEFLALADGPLLTGLVEVLCGGPATRATVNFCWLKLPGQPEHTTRPHQDLYYLHQCPQMWTVWLPLVDTPLELGPLGVVRRSHLGGVLPHVSPTVGMELPATTEWVTAGVKPGDVVIFDALTIHCAWSNVTAEHIRASFDLRYQPTRAATGVAVMTPDHDLG